MHTRRLGIKVLPGTRELKNINTTVQADSDELSRFWRSNVFDPWIKKYRSLAQSRALDKGFFQAYMKLFNVLATPAGQTFRKVATFAPVHDKL